MYLHKLRDLQPGRVDMRIPNDLGESLASRIGLTRSMDSHSNDTIPYNYWTCQGESDGG